MTNTNPPGIVDRATLKQIYQTLTKNEVPLDKNGDTINFNPPNHQPDSALSYFLSLWEAKRAEEAQTMLPTRRPTPDELQRAMVIAKWFYAWNSSCSPCPIAITDSVWGKKLCSLFEWIAVLESEAKMKGQTQP